MSEMRSSVPAEVYTLWIDGAAYGGESTEAEALPPQTGSWWLQRPVETRSALLIGKGAPYRIESRRNLASHIDRLISRHRDGVLPFTEITIRREAE